MMLIGCWSEAEIPGAISDSEIGLWVDKILFDLFLPLMIIV